MRPHFLCYIITSVATASLLQHHISNLENIFQKKTHRKITLPLRAIQKRVAPYRTTLHLKTLLLHLKIRMTALPHHKSILVGKIGASNVFVLGKMPIIVIHFK